ncbi:MAG: phytanoyl-CoA dioxygenase family protein [Pseudomonadota bacterium]
MSQTQMADFDRQGYLVLESALDPADLTAVQVEYEALLAHKAEDLFTRGQITSPRPELPFAQRYGALLDECRQVFQELDITLPVQQSLPAHAPVHCGPAVFDLITHPKVLDIVESIIGPEILSNPTQHLRLKPPEKTLAADLKKGIAGRTTWHQDLAGLLDEALETDLLTVWIAVSDAWQDQGCLVVIPGSHKNNHETSAAPGGMTTHCPESEKVNANFIAGRRLAPGPRVPLPVPRGSVVLMHKLTQHASLPNRSERLRFAFDLRYQPVGQPTGRPAFPAFVARSRKDPEAVLRSAEDWQALWQKALAAIQSGAYHGPIYETARWEAYGAQPPC